MSAKMKKLFFLLLLVLSGCDKKCIYPGEGTTLQRKTVNIPLYQNKSSMVNGWIDTGISIEKGGKAVIEMSGAFDLCGGIIPLDPSKIRDDNCYEVSCSTIEVPNMFCVNNENLTWNENSQKINCNSGVSKDGYYVDTNLSVSGGEELTFDVVLTELKRDVTMCRIPIRGTAVYDESDVKLSDGHYLKDDSGNNADPTSICESGGTIVIGDKKDKLVIPSIAQGYSALGVAVLNGYTPKSNRVILRKNQPWIDAAEADLRFTVPAIVADNTFCVGGREKIIQQAQEDSHGNNVKKKYEDIANEVLQGGTSSGKEVLEKKRALRLEYYYQEYCNDKTGQKVRELKRFSTKKVNTMCGNLNATGKYGAGYSYIFSVRDDEISDVFSDPSKGPTGCCGGQRYWDDASPKRFADLLVAKLGEPGTSSGQLSLYSDPAQKCIYSVNNNDIDFGGDLGIKSCMDIRQYGGNVPSLPLGRVYKVPDSVQTNSPMLLGIASEPGQYDRHEYSGYRITARKTCALGLGKKVYIYVGSAPTWKPGEKEKDINSELSSGFDKPFINIAINKDEGEKAPDGSVLAVADLNKNGVGKVYIGLDPSIYESDTVRLLKEGQYKLSEYNRYQLNVTQTVKPSHFSSLFQVIYKEILELFYGQVDSKGNHTGGVITSMYNLIVKGIAPVVQAAMVLYFVLYGLSFLMGLIRDPRSDVVMRVVKIAFIALLISPQSWDFFGRTVFDLFVASANQLISYFTGNVTGNHATDNPFQFLDSTFGMVLTNEFWIRMISLWSSGTGFIIFFLIIWGFLLFIAAVVEAMIVYLMIVVSTALLFLLSPIFISFILFQRTKPLFEGWLKMMLSFALRPIFIFGTLALLNTVMMAPIFRLNDFAVCPGCSLNVNISGYDICLFENYIPFGVDSRFSLQDRVEMESENPGYMLGVPFSFATVLVFLVVAHVISSYLKITDSMVDMITGTMMGYTGSSGGGSPSDAGASALQGLLSIGGIDKESRDERGGIINRLHKRRRNVKLEGVGEKGGKKSADGYDAEESSGKTNRGGPKTDHDSVDDNSNLAQSAQSTDDNPDASNSTTDNSTNSGSDSTVDLSSITTLDDPSRAASRVDDSSQQTSNDEGAFNRDADNRVMDGQTAGERGMQDDQVNLGRDPQNTGTTQGDNPDSARDMNDRTENELERTERSAEINSAHSDQSESTEPPQNAEATQGDNPDSTRDMNDRLENELGGTEPPQNEEGIEGTRRGGDSNDGGEQ